MDDFATGFLAGQDNGSGGGNGGGAWGDANSWIWIIVVFALLFGWGRNGEGGGSGNGGGNGMAYVPYMTGGFNASSTDTRSAISEGFAMNNLQSGINAIQNGICDSTYALNNAITGGFNTTNMGIMQGFNGVQSQLCNMSAQNQACCCETQRIMERGFADTNYRMATDTCAIQNTIQNTTRDLLDNANSNTRAILDFLTQDKISTLTAENQTLRFQASQNAQNGFIDSVGNSIIARLQQPSPVPAYSVPAPYPYCTSTTSSCGCC